VCGDDDKIEFNLFSPQTSSRAGAEGFSTDSDGGILDRIEERGVMVGDKAVDWRTVIKNGTDEGEIKRNEYLPVTPCDGTRLVFKNILSTYAFGFNSLDMW